MNLNTLAFVSFKIRTDFELSIIEVTKIGSFAPKDYVGPPSIVLRGARTRNFLKHARH